jgi:hypothetical protein
MMYPTYPGYPVPSPYPYPMARWFVLLL